MKTCSSVVPRSLQCLVALLLVGLSATAKGTSIPDWMRQAATEQVTFDKKAPAAVLLDEEVMKVSSNGEVNSTLRRVIKILRPQGREYALLTASFDKSSKIRSLRAWSISSAGEEYELKEKDFYETGHTEELYSDVRAKVVRAPAADPGAVIGIEVEEQSHPYIPEGIWNFQERIPVHLARYTLQLPSGWEYKTSFFRYSSVEPKAADKNTFVWEVKDVSGIDEQPSMPPASALLGRMTLAYYGPGQPFSFGSWQKIGAWYSQLIRDRRNDSPELAEKARQLTAGMTSTFDKAAALAAYMQSKIRYVAIEIGIGGYQPHLATDVFHNGYGDCKDKATLLSSMLKDVGVSSQLVLVHTHRGTVMPDVPSADFNHAILAVEWPASEAADARIHSMVTTKSGTHWVIFDPTDSYTPFGDIGDHLEGNNVLIAADSDSELVQLPVNKPERNELRRSGKFKLMPDGTLIGEIEETRTGDAASNYRGYLISLSEKDRRKGLDELLAESLHGFVLDDFSIDNLNQNDKPLMVHYKFSARNYATATRLFLMLRPRVLKPQGKSIGDEPRKYPVFYRYPAHDVESYTIELPPGYIVDDLPAPAAAEMGFAAFNSKAVFKDGALQYTADYTIRELIVDTARADDIKRLNGIMFADGQSSATLKKSE